MAFICTNGLHCYPYHCRSSSRTVEDYHPHDSVSTIHRLVYFRDSNTLISSEKCQHGFDTPRNDFHNSVGEYLRRSTPHDPLLRILAEGTEIALRGHEILGRNPRLRTQPMAENSNYDYLFWSDTGIRFLEIFLNITPVCVSTLFFRQYF